MQNTIIEFVAKLNEKFPRESLLSSFFEYEIGKKYFKIVSVLKGAVGETISNSAYAFIDKETGDLFKPASWAAPAKHARGNILNETGINACGRYGVVRLKN